MLPGIMDYLEKNYPDVKIVSATMVETPKTLSQEIPLLNFYDVTFEYKGKKFSKLFHTELKEPIDSQFKEALLLCDIQIS